MSTLPNITPELIKKYQEQLGLQFSPSSIKRKNISVGKFLAWAKTQGHIEENPLSQIHDTKFQPQVNRIPVKSAGKSKLSNWYNRYQSIPGVVFLNIAVAMLLTSAVGLGIYNQFFRNAKSPLALTALNRPNRFLSFQGRLTNQYGNPITATTSAVFKLYDNSSGGSTLWDSGACSVSPDPDGVFSTLLGSGCGAELTSSVFSDNAGVWLGVQVAADVEATPRIQIATVAYALNSETIQGYTASSSATANTVPVINNSGQIVLAVSSPKIQSTAGTFAIEGQVLTIQTPSSSNGSITIAPDGTGSANLNFSGAAPGAGGFVNATNANITSKSLYYGSVASNATGYNLLQLQAGSTPANRFTIDAVGNATASGTINGLAVSNGTISTGTWNGSLVSALYGGTGANNSTAAQYSIPYYSTTGVLGGVVAPGTDGYVLTTHNTGGVPTWTDVSSVGTNYWALGAGTIYPGNTTMDLLLGASATASAKFAFTGVNSGTPTASISGTTAATFIDGNGNISTTNRGNLTLGNSATYNTTGNILLNPNGTGNVGIGTTSPSQKLDVNGNVNVSGYATMSGSLAVGNTTALTGPGNINASGRITGTIIYQGANQVCDAGGAVPGCTSGGTNYWQLNNKIIAPANTTYDLTIGGNATESAFQVFGIPTVGGSIAKINSSVITTGNLLSVTSTSLTTGSALYLANNTANNANLITAQAGASLSNRLTLDSNGLLKIYDTTGADYLSLTHNGTDAQITTNTGNVEIGTGGGNLTVGDASDAVDIHFGYSAVPVNIEGEAGSVINFTQAGNITPTTTGNYDLGTNSLRWRNIYGTTIYQGANQVCDVSGNCTGSAIVKWRENLGTLSPYSSTLDVLIGSNATASAKFAFKNVLTGVPTASIAGTTAGVATYLTGEGNLAITNMGHLTLGGATTGMIDASNDLNLATGKAYFINGTSVLNNNTLGTGVLTSSLTTVGILASGSINTGFGTILTGNTITGTTLNGTTGINTGATAGIQRIDANGNLLNIANISASGYATVSGSIAIGNTTALAGPGNINASGTITGVAVYQGANQVCDAGGAISGCGGLNYWQLTDNSLSPANSTYALNVGNTASTSAFFHVPGTNNADAWFNLGTGNVGIGTTSPGYTLDVSGDLNVTGTVGLGLRTPIANALINMEKTYPDTSNAVSYGILNIVNVTPSTQSLNQPNGIYSRIDLENTAWINDNAYSIQSIALGNANDANAKINAMYAGSFSTYFTNADVYNATNAGSLYLPGTDAEDGTIGSAYSINAVTPTVDTGDITSAAYGFRLQDGAAPTTGSIANLYPIYIDADARTVTTNKYGLWMGTMSGAGTNNYQLYIAGTADSYFAGDIIAQKIVDTSSSTYYLDPASGTTSLYINGGITSDNGTAFNIDSVSNKPIYLDAGSGTVYIGSAGAGKLDAGTIDPPYTIEGGKYATYQPSMTGVKEETTGTISTSEYVPGVGYRSVIDFAQSLTGSDLWLFSKITNLTQNFDKMVVLLSPSSNTKSWYGFDSSGKLSIYTSRPTSVSYRLTAPRFDFTDWKNTRNSENAGFIVPDSNSWPVSVSLDNSGGIGLDNLAIETATGSASIAKKYNLIDTTSGQIIDELATFSEAMIANLRSGLIIAKEVTTDSFIAFQGTVDNLLINSGLVTPNVKVALISPLPGNTDITVQIGSATESGKLAIVNGQGTEVASIDDTGNARLAGDLQARQATFSGTLFANDIKSKSLDDITSLLTQVTADQNLLKEAANWNILTATDSANLNEIAVADLYVTNQAAINSLSVTNALTVGSDLVFQSTINNQQLTINSIDTLSAPLKIQSLAMAPLEIMAGLVTIDTHGNVNIAGDLYVAGKIKASGLTLSAIDNQETATGSALLTLQNQGGTQVASVNSSGSAQFSTLSTPELIIAGADATQSGTIINGVITTNSTVGQAVVPAYTSEITINNPKVTDYTLVYVTPTSSTQNNVLYVKSKQAGQFVVGFAYPLDADVSFNWWIVQVKQ